LPSIKKSQEITKIKNEEAVIPQTVVKPQGKLYKGPVLSKHKDDKDGFKLGDIMVKSILKIFRKLLKKKIT